MGDPNKLTNFFVEHYDKTDLKAFVTGVDAQQEFVHKINWDQAHEYVARDVTKNLQMRGYIDAGLRASLVASRPAFEAEVLRIWAIVATFTAPVVTFAMTKAEADGLDPAVRQQLQAALGPQVLDRYGDRRDDWRPAGPNTPGVQQLVNDAMAKYSALRPPGVTPTFLGDGFFAPGPDQAATWEALEYARFLLIIDPVSLFHPSLCQQLVDSRADSYRNVILGAFLPLQVPLIHPILDAKFQQQLRTAYRGFQQRLLPTREFGLTSPYALERWLFATFPESGVWADPIAAASVRRDYAPVGMTPTGGRR